MLRKGAARKVTIFVNEDTRHHFAPLADAILTFLLHKGVAGATVTRAAAGFGAHHALHSTNMESRAEHLPVRIEFIESPERVDELMPTLSDMLSDGLIEVQDTEVVKAANREQPAAPAPHAEIRGAARLMRVYLGESDRWHGAPLYEAIVQSLHRLDIAGATVYRGILGYGSSGHTHKGGVMISVVDTQEHLDRAIAEIEAMMADGLIVLSDVEVIRLVHRAND